MQFIDLARQQRDIRADIEARIKAVLDHGKYIMGPEVAELETALADFAGAKHCISCASGTDALLMPLMAWEIGPGDAVFMPSFSFFATAEVVAMLGATPIFVDIDPVSFNMQTEALEKAILAVQGQDNSLHPLPSVAKTRPLTPKAIIPVDLYGQAAGYSSILPLAEKHGLMVLEDAAQAFGGEYKGKKTCGLGCTAAATSFFPAKPLGCYGDGGAIFTDDDALAEILRSIRFHGKGDDKYDNVRIGMNGRLDTLQAAILLAKLAVFPAEIVARQQVAAWYGEALSKIAGITPPKIAEHNVSAFAQYCILFSDNSRNTVQEKLGKKGIPSMIYYPKPMHTLKALAPLGYAPEMFPVSMDCASRILALPFHPYLEKSDVATVAAGIAEALA